MSHFSTIRTKIKNKPELLEALELLQYDVTEDVKLENPLDHEHKQWQVDVAVGNDIGFRLNKQGEYELVADIQTWNQPIPPARFIEKVKMDGVDDNGNTSWWKGYKKQGTKAKGGKEVKNCVKAGFEPEGEEIQEGEEINIHDTEEWKAAAKKQTSRIMDMWKEGYGKKKKKSSCS